MAACIDTAKTVIEINRRGPPALDHQLFLLDKLRNYSKKICSEYSMLFTLISDLKIVQQAVKLPRVWSKLKEITPR
jgi:hypothetical protein